ncbi:PfkB family carbohydrate kinase [Geomonas sp. Red32]|uniref:carbohydrate kinase family protein n=1 Tax=Geomonas sp. Red32 TaxID=2912856 RepID=UPI00202CCF8B|nr:PfkB family carbohydrate kinase [Geomonas sp. Red32]MCM0081837.1 PfkB family carbohydrate kinase [Geomonas sp. Red32]
MPDAVEVVGLGVSTLDLLMQVERFPEGEGVAKAHASVLQGGGPVATAMVTLARLGARTSMIDRVGDDWRGRLIVEEFLREGVGTGHLLVQNGASSSIASIMVRKDDGARHIVYAPGDVEELSPADLPEDAIASARILHLNGRHFEASLAAAALAKRKGVTVSFDGGAHRFRPELLPLIKLTDVCIVAREFAFSCTGKNSLADAAAALIELGPKIVAITAGAEGSWVFAGKESFYQPAFAVEHPVDTTGAGDAYHGAFLYGILRGYGLRRSAALATAVAARVVTALGGRGALPTSADLDQLLDALPAAADLDELL